MAASRKAIPHARSARTVRTVTALIFREMSTTYGRSAGGYLWAFLDPILSIAFFTIVLSLGLRIRSPALGISFPLFFATAVLPLRMYMTLAQKMAQALNFSRPLLFYPGVTYADALISRFILNFLTHLLVMHVIFAGIILTLSTRALVDPHPMILSVLMTALIGAGVGTLNCYLFSAFPVWAQIWGILTTPLFFMSTVFYTYEDLPKLGQDILWYNPLVHIVGLMRRGIYPQYDAAWVSLTYGYGFGAILLVFGMLLLHRYHRDILNN